MVTCEVSDDNTTALRAPAIGAAKAGDASVGIALIAQALLAAGCRVAVNDGHDKLAAEAGFINGITLSINGGEYLS